MDARDPRRVLALTVDHENRLVVSLAQELRWLAMSDLFSVLVQWDEVNAESWRGWLTTFDHWAVSFGADNMTAGVLLGWLSELPGWDRSMWTRALNTRGIHLVWRNPGDLPTHDQSPGVDQEQHGVAGALDEANDVKARVPMPESGEADRVSGRFASWAS